MPTNPVIAALLKEFATTQNLTQKPESEQFEHFLNYIVMADAYHGDFDVVSLSTGNHEFGLDGLAIVVNGSLIEATDEIEEHCNFNKYLKVDFYFIQSKMQAKFDSGDLLKMFNAIDDFFGAEGITLSQGEEIHQKWEIKERIYEKAGLFLHGLPTLHIVYATLGQYVEDINISSIIKSRVNTLKSTNLFEKVNFSPLDLKRVQDLYYKSKNSSTTTINFPSSIALPAIPRVSEAYIGVLSSTEYVKVVSEDQKTIKLSIFSDNVRDIQPKSDVNVEIDKTLRSDRNMEFPLRNNGVTIVCRKLQKVGTSFTLTDYQVVNGCQTSNVIMDNVNSIKQDLVVPLKIICSEDEDVTNAVIRGSNRQNEVSGTQFWALEPIHKEIEIFFDKAFVDDLRLYYERRRGQYARTASIEKVRIVSPESLLKDFAALAVDEPHQVSKYYTGLLPLVGKTIFVPSQSLYVYHAAAYVIFKLEQLFRNGYLPSSDRKFRYLLAMSLKYKLLDGRQIAFGGTQAQKDAEILTAFVQTANEFRTLSEQLVVTIRGAMQKAGLDDERQAVKSATLRNEVRRLFLKPALANPAV